MDKEAVEGNGGDDNEKGQRKDDDVDGYQRVCDTPL